MTEVRVLVSVEPYKAGDVLDVDVTQGRIAALLGAGYLRAEQAVVVEEPAKRKPRKAVRRGAGELEQAAGEGDGAAFGDTAGAVDDPADPGRL